MRATVVALIGYFVVATATAGAIALQVPTPREYETTRSMPINHRLVEGDVRTAGAWHRFLMPGIATTHTFTGRYTNEPYGRGATIALSDTRARPQLGNAGAFLAWVALSDTPKPAVDALDAGTVVDVCGTDLKECLLDQHVSAVTCSAASCFAAIWLPKDKHKAFLATLESPKTKHLYVLPHAVKDD